LEKGNWWRWSLSTLFLILAILAKPNFLFLGLLYIYLLLEKKEVEDSLMENMAYGPSVSWPGQRIFLLLHSIAENFFKLSP